MSRGYNEPLDCCDEECAAVNSCQIGGCQCERCGRYFCADELDECGYCESCAREIAAESESEEEDDNG